MKIEFSNEDLAIVLAEHLRSQGMNMKGRTVTVQSKSKYLGKGMGSRVTVIADVSKADETITEEEEPEENIISGPIFGDDEL
jgi:hypothetical protein